MSTGAGSTAGYPVGWEADVLLRDGRPVHLRPMVPEDADRLRAFHASLSDRTVYFRFFSAKPTLTDDDVTRFTQVDHHDRVALVALDGGDFIGVGRYDTVGGGVAEVAFVIRDDMQGRGLGSVLLEHLAAAARECGLTRFTAEVLPQNGRMLATFRQAGFALDQRREDDVIVLAFDIEPTASSLEVMTAREHRADARSVHRLLHPGTVAVVGAGRNPGGLGHALLGNLVRGGFRGRLIAVHHEVDEILGVPCVRSLADVDGSVDLCAVVVPANDVRQVIEQAAAAAVHGVVVVSGGFGDAGGDGPRLQQELVDLVRGAGMRLVGPNALGLLNTDDEVRLNASLIHRMPRAGTVGFFSQSGALGGSILDRLEGRGLGVSTFVSAGNRADISGNDVLQYWLDDEDTSLVLLHLETIGNPRKFVRLVRRLAARKPVIMVRAGGAEARHPSGHAVRSTALSQRAVDQVMGAAGLVLVDGIDQLLDAAMVLAGGLLPGRAGVAIIGNSDALSVMAANAADRLGLPLDGDPVTFARQESAEAYRTEIARAKATAGAVIAIHVPPIERPGDTEVRQALRASADGSLLVAVMPDGGVGIHGVPVFRDVEAAVAALAAARRLAEWRWSDAPEPASADGEGEALDLAGPDVTVPDVPALGVQSGDAVLELLGQAHVDMHMAETTGLGWRIGVRDDPLFGAVVRVGIDDAVAEVLDDAAYRIAPVDRAEAATMLASIAARDAAIGNLQADQRAGFLAALASVVSEASILGSAPTVSVEVELGGVRPAAGAMGDLTVGRARTSVSPRPHVLDPAARRL
ncbi:MAG: GNAT family N-acetyltransferase [Actinomycetota bacterium]|nr:GNAT family N-acetyltransferase [Actinomycetota bacterium]